MTIQRSNRGSETVLYNCKLKPPQDISHTWEVKFLLAETLTSIRMCFSNLQSKTSSSRCNSQEMSTSMIRLLDEVLDYRFKIDRDLPSCKTPRRNKDIESNLTFAQSLLLLCHQVERHFTNVIFPL